MSEASVSGMHLMLDNTSFQHLAFLLPQHRKLRLSPEGVLDTLYLIESLLLADSISVPVYPGSTSYEEGDRLSGELRELVSSDGSPLLRRKLAQLDSVERMAIATVEALYEVRGPCLVEPDNLRGQVSSQGGIPRTGQDITHQFWSKVSGRKMRKKDLPEYAQQFLAERGADGALAYGLVHYEAVCDQLVRLIRNRGVPDASYWHRLLVLFRAHDNVRLANHIGLRYAPGHARQGVLEATRIWSLDRLWSSLKPHLSDIRREIGLEPGAWYSHSEGSRGFPFLGLAVFNQLPRSGDARLATILRLREDPGVRDLRSQTSMLDLLYETDTRKGLKHLLRECAQLKAAVTDDLQISTGGGRHLKTPDAIDPGSLIKFGLSLLPHPVNWARGWRYRRRPRTQLLLRCAATAVGEPSVEAGLREYLGRAASTRFPHYLEELEAEELLPLPPAPLSTRTST
jgi:hypothetical protein